MKHCDVSDDVQAARELRNVARMEAHMARISEQERQTAAQYEHSVRTQAERTRHAQKREETQRRQQQAATERPDVLITSVAMAACLQ